ncbi:MAG: ABC transporter ATP-binding protein [Candidatus Rokuibacteriota bacterium]|nr:MAG: ABC transporter ATP-binding protein [Candidatus Rokubacteria bacterium]
MAPAGLGPAARALSRYLSRYRARYALGIACLLTATASSLAIPWTVQRAIEALEADTVGAAIGRYVGLVLLLAATNGIARLGSRFSIMGGAQRIEHDLRNDLYAALQRFPPAEIARRTTGDLMTRATSDAGAVRSLVGFGAISFIGTIAAFVGALTAMVSVDPWLTLWAMAPYPILIVIAKRANARIHAETDAAQHQLGVLSSTVQEHLAGMSVVRAYTMEEHAARVFDAANGEYLGRSLRLARTMAAFVPLTGVITGVGALIVLWLGGREVIAGRLSLGALVAFNGYLAYLAWPTLALGWTLALLRRGLTSMARVQEIIDGAPPREATTDGETAPGSATAPRIGFQNLTFAYDDRGPALRDVTFEIRPGETVAVVGPTGSGKSTLGALLARLWEPPPGAVLLDGRDVRTLPLRALRGTMGYVPQEAFLFSRSVSDNVSLEREALDAARVRDAAVASGVAEEIEGFPRGWQTVVGERGLTLSGGQRQRVALARALAGNPSLIVLDDVFASVDAAKEDEILRQLRPRLAGRTVLLMTHRLHAAQAADRIVVLVDGRVVQQGTHDELLRADGAYAQLWRIQQLEEEIAGA